MNVSYQRGASAHCRNVNFKSVFFFFLSLRETFSYFNPLCLQYEIKILDIYLFIKKLYII